MQNLIGPDNSKQVLLQESRNFSNISRRTDGFIEKRTLSGIPKKIGIWTKWSQFGISFQMKIIWNIIPKTFQYSNFFPIFQKIFNIPKKFRYSKNFPIFQKNFNIPNFFSISSNFNHHLSSFSTRDNPNKVY